MSEEKPQTTLPTPVGDVRLIKTGKTRRFTEVRRNDGFAWSLDSDNVLTDLAVESLETDLAGSVAANLFERSSMVWLVAPDVPVAHDPDDLTQLEETRGLREAAKAIADAMRDEIDPDAITEDALSRIGGDFYGGSPGHVQIGRRVKADPERPESYFGRLAPLGVTNLGVVLPWLGYVPAVRLTDWFHWWFHDVPWISGPTLELEELEHSIWVRPSYRTSSLAVEFVGARMEVPVASEAPHGLPELHFECDRINVCKPLRMAFARNLRIVGSDLDRLVSHIIPLAVADDAWSAFPAETPGLREASSTDEIGILCPFGEEDALRHIESNEELLFDILWMTERYDDFPLDPWEHVAIPHHYVSSRQTGEVRSFDFDERHFRRDLARVFVASYGNEAWEGAITAVAQAVEKLRGCLGELERAVSTARTMGVNPAPLDQIEASVERIREEMVDPSWRELTGEE